MNIHDQANNISLRRIVPKVDIMRWVVLFGDIVSLCIATRMK